MIYGEFNVIRDVLHSRHCNADQYHCVGPTDDEDATAAAIAAALRWHGLIRDQQGEGA